MTRRKTILELMLLDEIPLWIIEIWANEQDVSLDELCDKAMLRRRYKYAGITGLMLMLIGILGFPFPKFLEASNHILVSGLNICLGTCLLAYATAQFHRNNRIEQRFVHDFYDLIDTVKDTGNPTWDSLWLRLVHESESTFLKALRERMLMFAEQHQQNLLQLAASPTLSGIERVSNANRFDQAWTTLLRFGFGTAELEQDRETYLRTARETLRAASPELFGGARDTDTVDAGALAEGGG